MRLRIGAKFLIVFALLVPAIFAVPVAALVGLGELRDDADELYSHNVRTARQTQHLARGLDDGFELALQLIPNVTSQARLDRLNAELDTKVIPRVGADIAALRSAHGDGPEARQIDRIARGWSRFVALAHSGELDRIGTSAEVARLNDATARRLARIMAPLTSIAEQLGAGEAAEAQATSERAQATYRSGRAKVLGLATAAVLLCLLALLWLIRDIVPRTREYSRFAAQVVSGSATEPVDTRGSDELSSLGQTLNAMVARRAEERTYAETQNEFVDAMQLTESEGEAHGLLKRHLERSIPHSEAVVLNRNNSHDRLEPTTPIDFDSPLEHALRDAHPRSCLAVRFARMHEEGNGREPLLECELCGKRASERATCEPLLVSGEVIGSLLVQHADPLTEDHYDRIKGSVVQAAPVLANLRNLAIAELRASTDALTGLPNNRALQGHMKRMVAHGLRTDDCVAVALLDLDHFKQINDTWGHGKGDEVLAAVGAVLQTTLREADVVGRWGGEEFLILLPDADRDAALTAAEKVREAIMTVTVVGVERAITASLGVAILPDHGTDIATLTRNADRALYTAKARGRNRVELFSAQSEDGVPLDARSASA
jgi:diguanylate cyclase (GGDEF)-like protein